MTKALIVVESYFGNTRAIAEAVAAGLIEGSVDAQVVDVSQAPSALPADLDLLVLTVISKGWLSGSAAKAIAKALQRHQGRRTVSVRSFVVTASKGPLADGE